MQQDNEISMIITLNLFKLYLIKLVWNCVQGYDNVSGSNETVISSRIPSTQESTFRRPLIPQAYHKMGAPEAFQTQLDVIYLWFIRTDAIWKIKC